MVKINTYQFVCCFKTLVAKASIFDVIDQGIIC